LTFLVVFRCFAFKLFNSQRNAGNGTGIRLTVKMTGVMILTLLPALMIVTAGPGVLSVLHSLESAQR
jgi:hypothetical protein